MSTSQNAEHTDDRAALRARWRGLSEDERVPVIALLHGQRRYGADVARALLVAVLPWPDGLEIRAEDQVRVQRGWRSLPEGERNDVLKVLTDEHFEGADLARDLLIALAEG